MAQQRQLVLALVLAGAGLAGGLLAHRFSTTPTHSWSTANGNDARALTAATLLPDPRDLPEFSLTEGSSGAFTRASLRGQWTLMFFGFANCPDVCPTTMALLASVVDKLRKADVEPPDVVFISVDPERDSPADAARYAAYFDPSFRAASGDQDSLRELTRPLGIMHMRVSTGADTYSVDHSAAILLINPSVQLRALFSAPHDADTIVADLHRIIERH